MAERKPHPPTKAEIREMERKEALYKVDDGESPWITACAVLGSLVALVVVFFLVFYVAIS